MYEAHKSPQQAFFQSKLAGNASRCQKNSAQKTGEMHFEIGSWDKLVRDASDKQLLSMSCNCINLHVECAILSAYRNEILVSDLTHARTAEHVTFIILH